MKRTKLVTRPPYSVCNGSDVRTGKETCLEERSRNTAEEKEKSSILKKTNQSPMVHVFESEDLIQDNFYHLGDPNVYPSWHFSTFSYYKNSTCGGKE